jgi:hypothetical protein
MLRGALTATGVAALAAMTTAATGVAASNGPPADGTAATLVTGRAHVHITPHLGGPRTTFHVGVRVTVATGTFGTVRRRDTIVVSGPDRQGCASSASVALPNTAAGAQRSMALHPRRFGGHWCKGRFNGRVVETSTIVCGGPHLACPQVVVAPQTIARFHFRVR